MKCFKFVIKYATLVPLGCLGAMVFLFGTMWAVDYVFEPHLGKYTPFLWIAILLSLFGAGMGYGKCKEELS